MESKACILISTNSMTFSNMFKLNSENYVLFSDKNKGIIIILLWYSMKYFSYLNNKYFLNTQTLHIWMLNILKIKIIMCK